MVYQVVGQTHSPDAMQISFDELTSSRSEIQRVGTATEQYELYK